MFVWKTIPFPIKTRFPRLLRHSEICVTSQWPHKSLELHWQAQREDDKKVRDSDDESSISLDKTNALGMVANEFSIHPQDIGRSPFSIGNTSSFTVDYPASHVSSGSKFMNLPIFFGLWGGSPESLDLQQKLWESVKAVWILGDVCWMPVQVEVGPWALKMKEFVPWKGTIKKKQGHEIIWSNHQFLGGFDFDVFSGGWCFGGLFWVSLSHLFWWQGCSFVILHRLPHLL